jgi:hypothetical protein
MAVARDEDILRFEVAMENTVIVSGSESARDLKRVFDCFAHRQRTAIQPRSQSFAVEQFGDDVGGIVLAANIEDCQNIRMIERGCSSRFLLEARTLMATSRPKRGSRAR